MRKQRLCRLILLPIAAMALAAPALPAAAAGRTALDADGRSACTKLTASVPAAKALTEAEGFEIGVGPSVVVVDEGMGKSLTTMNANEDVYAFVFGQKGLMGVSVCRATRSPRLPSNHPGFPAIRQSRPRGSIVTG